MVAQAAVNGLCPHVSRVLLVSQAHEFVVDLLVGHGAATRQGIVRYVERLVDATW